MNTKKMIISLVAIIIIAIGAFAFVRNSEKADNMAAQKESVEYNPSSETLANSESPTPSQSTATKEFTITSQNFSFAPSIIRVKKGDNVKITLKNTKGLHDLVIDEFNVSTEKIKDSGESSISFTANKTGSFEYYCSVADHRAMGMKGTLVVED